MRKDDAMAVTIPRALTEYLPRVRERVRERDERRRQRAARAADVSEDVFAKRLHALRARVMADLRVPEAQRTSAFHPLTQDDLGFLERQVAAYARDERLIVLERNTILAQWLNILRVNLAVGSSVISCDQFRFAGRQCIRHQRAALAECLERWDGQAGAPPFVRRIVPVLPWRAGLLYGEIFRSEGTSFLWHIGAKRNERTLAAEIYHESAPPSALRNRTHLVCDPMLATGGTQIATIDRLIVGGVAPERIIAVAVVAAPEGVDLLCSRYSEVRIVTCGLDECLDERGYITGPGLGDFGDLAYGDLDEAYVTEHWLASGLLTRPQAELILSRMRGNGSASAAK